MWYINFWILLIAAVIFAGLTAYIRKFHFIDVQVLILITAIAMSCDMIFCKQLDLYRYVSFEYRGWYSFWANLFIVPSWGLIFIKYVPAKMRRAAFFIVAWAGISTLFELFIVKPYGIVIYREWNIVPYSLIGYTLVLAVIYIYYKSLLKQSRA